MDEVTLSRLMKGNRKGKLDSQFYSDFADLYNDFKSAGLTPGEVKTKVKSTIKCGDTRYYDFLREARCLGFITDQEEIKKENLKRASEFMHNYNEIKRTNDEPEIFKGTIVNERADGVPPLVISSSSMIANFSYNPISGYDPDGLVKSVKEESDRPKTDSDESILTPRTEIHVKKKGLFSAIVAFFRGK